MTKKNRPNLVDHITSITQNPIETEKPKPKQAVSKTRKQVSVTETTPDSVPDVQLTAYVHPKVKKEIKMLSIEYETTVKALLDGGIEHILKKYGRQTMKEISEK